MSSIGGDLLFDRHPKNGGVVEFFEDRRRFNLCGFLPDDAGDDTDSDDNGESIRFEWDCSFCGLLFTHPVVWGRGLSPWGEDMCARLSG